MKEAVVERYLRQEVELAGGICEKHVSPGRRDVPDRLVTWGHGAMDLVETKRPGGKARAGQLRDHRERARRGVHVYLIDTKEKVDSYVRARKDNGLPAWLWSV